MYPIPGPGTRLLNEPGRDPKICIEPGKKIIKAINTKSIKAQEILGKTKLILHNRT